MIRRPRTIAFWRGRLPHWEVEVGRYFVTIHLANAIPADAMSRIIELARSTETDSAETNGDHSLPVMRTIFRDMEAWLDRCEPTSLLAQPTIARMVIESIQHRASQREWEVYSFVIMPSHLHLFLSIGEIGLKKSLEEFKRWTGHQAGRLVELPNGRFWQDEWFDHWSRSDEQDEKIVRYIQ